MKNVLMIIPFFPPNAGGGVYRPLGFVKYLREYGWRPIVVTMESGSFWIGDKSLLLDVPEECRVVRTKTLSGQYFLSLARRDKKTAPGGAPALGAQATSSQVRSSRRFGLLRKIGATVLVPDTYIGWYPFAVREALRIISEEKIDAIYSTSPPETSHLIASRLHEKTRIPWVADFRDPWMNLYLLPRPTPIHEAIHRRLEKKVCSKASTIVTNLWHRELLLERYPSIGEVELIRNGYDPSHVEPVMKLSPPADRFRIVHAGMLTQKRSAVPFLRALKVFVDRVPEARDVCRVEFFGPRESENDTAVAELGLDGIVEFKDTVSHDQALKIERTSHILLLIKHTDPVYNGIIPGKLYEYIGVQRPILALAPDGEAGDIVRRLRRGEVVSQNDTGAIASRLQLLYERFREGTLDAHYDLSQVDEFRRDVLTEKLARTLDSLVNERN